MNVCLIKAAGFAPQRIFKGGSQLVKELEMKMAEILTKCWEWVTNNRFERLQDQNCWVWLPGVTEGGATAGKRAENKNG